MNNLIAIAVVVISFIFGYKVGKKSREIDDYYNYWEGIIKYGEDYKGIKPKLYLSRNLKGVNDGIRSS